MSDQSGSNPSVNGGTGMSFTMGGSSENEYATGAASSGAESIKDVTTQSFMADGFDPD